MTPTNTSSTAQTYMIGPDDADEWIERWRGVVDRYADDDDDAVGIRNLATLFAEQIARWQQDDWTAPDGTPIAYCDVQLVLSPIGGDLLEYDALVTPIAATDER